MAMTSIVRRHAACASMMRSRRIGLGCEEGRGRITNAAVGALCDRHDIGCGDQGVEIGEFAGKFLPGRRIGQILPALAAPGLDVLRQVIVEPAAISRMQGPKREITASRPALKSTWRTYQTTRSAADPELRRRGRACN